jgi:hypothetical protein
MNTNLSDETPPAGDDRWIDAVLKEHARLGTRADECLLRRLEDTLGPRQARRRRSTLTWSLAAAAAVALVASGIFLLNRNEGAAPGMAANSGSELVTDFPPELIEGTPKPVRVPKLVAVPDTPPTMRVPAGTVLLSRGKPVTSSDDFPIIGELSLVTDGDKDAGEGYYVELMDGLQWVQIDLERSAAIQAVWLWHFHSQRRAYHDVIVQVSDDPTFKTGVTTVYNNDYDGSAGMGVGDDHPYVESRYGLLVNAKGAKGRHVRLHSKGNSSNDMNHYIEVEVFGAIR